MLTPTLQDSEISVEELGFRDRLVACGTQRADHEAVEGQEARNIP